MITPRRGNDPEQFGPFQAIGHLGHGGFGNVYIGRHRGTGRLAAVKVLYARLAGNPDFRARFAREIRAIARADSEYVPRLIDHGGDEETLWLATELVRGPSLNDVVQRSGPLPERTVWRLALGIARGLGDIHNAELRHRDLKPGNVLLVPEGPRIIDFGLAHLTESDHQTASGLPLCSPQYAPPEQRRMLSAADLPADIFTLGGTLLFAATGHAPYGGEWDLLPAAAPNLADLPSALYDVISHCLYHAEDARPSLKELDAYFALGAGAAAGRGEPTFAATLTPGIMEVISTWRRELDEVIRLAGASPVPAPGIRPATPPADTRQLTAMPAPDRDGARLTLPEPGVAPQPFGGQRDDLRWRVQLGDWVRAPVAVRHDVAVAATLGGVVTCMSARSGNVRTQANLGVPVRSAVLLPTDTQAGWAYAGGADGVVYAIELASGRHRAVLFASGAIEGPLVAAGDRIYALSADGCVHEIDARGSGETAILCDLGVPALGTLTIVDGIVIAANAEGCVYAIDTTGNVRWRLPTTGLVFGAPAAVAGWLYISGTDGRLRTVRIDGSHRSTLDIGVPVHTDVVHDRGRLYVGGGDGMIRAFDISGTFAAEPALLWTSRELGDEISGIAALGGAVVVAAGRTLTALDGATGQLRASSPVGAFPTGALITASPVMTEGHVYVASLDGTVSCLSLVA
jgi:outer membrane protein assembly factor BamB